MGDHPLYFIMDINTIETFLHMTSDAGYNPIKTQFQALVS